MNIPNSLEWQYNSFSDIILLWVYFYKTTDLFSCLFYTLPIAHGDLKRREKCLKSIYICW